MLASLPFSNILVPVDSSEGANRALDFALKLAKPQNARIMVLYVVHKPTVADPFDVSMTARVLESMEQYGKEVLEAAKKRADGMGVKVETEMTSGYAVANNIVEYAKDGSFDLIVMGTRGRSGVERVLLGSVAFGVVTYARCNVVIVR